MAFSAEQVIESFYYAVLNRCPDEDGMRTHVKRLKSDPSALISIAHDLFHCSEHMALLAGFSEFSDHSQFGEFPILLRRLVRDGSKNQIVIDVGARGRERSNSFDLASQFGWKVILIEANADLYQEITEAFEGTDFTLIKCAVGATEGVMPFYIGSNDDVSSLIKDAASVWGDLRGQVPVEVRRLPAILEKLKIPLDFDLLSIDIEGVDVPVLNDLIDSSDYRPKYIIIEASYGFKTKKLSDVYCSGKVQSCYTLINQTEANLILQRRF